MKKINVFLCLLIITMQSAALLYAAETTLPADNAPTIAHFIQLADQINDTISTMDARLNTRLNQLQSRMIAIQQHLDTLELRRAIQIRKTERRQEHLESLPDAAPATTASAVSTGHNLHPQSRPQNFYSRGYPVTKNER